MVWLLHNLVEASFETPNMPVSLFSVVTLFLHGLVEASIFNCYSLIRSLLLFHIVPFPHCDLPQPKSLLARRASKQQSMQPQPQDGKIDFTPESRNDAISNKGQGNGYPPLIAVLIAFLMPTSIGLQHLCRSHCSSRQESNKFSFS